MPLHPGNGGSKRSRVPVGGIQGVSSGVFVPQVGSLPGNVARTCGHHVATFRAWSVSKKWPKEETARGPFASGLVAGQAGPEEISGSKKSNRVDAIPVPRQTTTKNL